MINYMLRLKKALPNRRTYLIDHKILFLFGYFFYLFIPWYVGANNLFEDAPGMSLYHEFFSMIPEEKINMYFIITLAWLPSFYLGHLLFNLIRPRKRQLDLFPATPLTRTVPYIALLLIGVLVVFAFLGRGSLFGGYESYDIAARGKMSTLLVVFNFFFLYQLLTVQKQSRLLVAGLIITGLLLLSMGGRMYVMQSFVIFLVYKTSFAPKRWKGYQVLAVGFAGFLVASFVGLWRMHTSFGASRAAYSLFAEPVFTWFSTTTYLNANDIPLFNMPLNFLSSFLNLIPNTVIKVQPYLVSTASMVKEYQNPLGADSIWSTFVINFGSAGSCIFIFITGFMLHFLRHLSERSRFGAVYYILVCGMVPFQLFRDGFYLLNKQLFFNFLLLPAAILFVMRCIMVLQTSVNRQAGAEI